MRAAGGPFEMRRDPRLTQTPSLVLTAFRQFSALIEEELALARREVSRSMSRAGAGLAMIGVAALLALVGLNVLATAVVGYLAQTGLSAGSAALIVAGTLIAAAAVLAMTGKTRLSADALAPKRTRETLKRDLKAAKEATHA